MNPVKEKLFGCFESIKDKVPFAPRVGLVLGSGLGNYADGMDIEGIIEYKDIEGFPVSTAPGHKGRFVFGHIGDTPVVCMQGRVHYYEGYDITDVVLPIRLMKLMGAEILFLTNASGGINRKFKAGDLMLITGQLSMLVPSPLRGENISELGVRFPDMSSIYKEELQKIVIEEAVKENINLKQGVYIQTAGPAYESPEEIMAYRLWGADAVGMSTACEAIAANHAGMKVVGISCISNLAAGISPFSLTEEEVLEAGRMVSETFSRLVTNCIKRM